jgi:hypothetical protein
MSLFPFSRLLPYMFRAFISPSSGMSQAVVNMQPFGSCSVFVDHLRAPADRFVTVKTPPQTSPHAHADDQQKHA